MESGKTIEKDIKQKSSRINLKYLITPQEDSVFPWKIVLGVVLAFILFFAILGYTYPTYRESVIVHEVSAGESLRSLALYYYDDPVAWHKIFLANRNKLLHNKKLVIGDRLKIPISQAQLSKFNQKNKVKLEARNPH